MKGTFHRNRALLSPKYSSLMEDQGGIKCHHDVPAGFPVALGGGNGAGSALIMIE
jgi:hypothetical protein